MRLEAVGKTPGMPQNRFIGRIAEAYDADSPEMFDPEQLTATVDFLAAQAQGGGALEFGIGTESRAPAE
jgi:hypothetical protein